MKAMITAIALALSLTFSSCAQSKPYSTANGLLEKAASDYSAAAKSVHSLSGDSLDGNLAPLMLASTAYEITGVQVKYLAAGESLELSAAQHGEMMAEIDKIVAEADNFITNEKIGAVVPPAVMSLLSEADQDVHKAADSARKGKHGA